MTTTSERLSDNPERPQLLDLARAVRKPLVRGAKIARRVQKIPDFPTKNLAENRGSHTVTTSVVTDEWGRVAKTTKSLIWINKATQDKNQRTLVLTVSWDSPNLDDMFPQVIVEDSKVIDGVKVVSRRFDSHEPLQEPLSLGTDTEGYRVPELGRPTIHTLISDFETHAKN